MSSSQNSVWHIELGTSYHSSDSSLSISDWMLLKRLHQAIEIITVWMYACVLSHQLVSDSSWPARLLWPGNFSGKTTGVGCHFLLQGILPTQGSNPCLLCLLHFRQILYPLSHQVSPHTYIFFQIAFHYRLQDTECSFLLHTINACCLSILYIVVVCIC